MNRLVITFCSLLGLSGLLGGCYYDNEEDLYQYVQTADCSSITEGSYQTHIAPSIETNCLRCHNNTRMDGNVNLEGYENVVPYATDGSLFGAANHETGYAIMPPTGEKIPACDLEAMRLWVEAGAPNN